VVRVYRLDNVYPSNPFIGPCGSCMWFTGFAESGEFVCKAFPNGVPLAIAQGKNGHSKAVPGDHGIRFEMYHTDLTEEDSIQIDQEFADLADEMMAFTVSAPTPQDITNHLAEGGPGSGNFGHKGIKGQRGGSAPAGAVAAPRERKPEDGQTTMYGQPGMRQDEMLGMPGGVVYDAADFGAEDFYMVEDAINTWRATAPEGRRMAMGALNSAEAEQVFVLEDESGVLGVVSGGKGKVSFLGSSQTRPGTGTALMYEAAARMRGDDGGLTLYSVDGAIGFYEKLGMRNRGKDILSNHWDLTTFTWDQAGRSKFMRGYEARAYGISEAEFDGDWWADLFALEPEDGGFCETPIIKEGGPGSGNFGHKGIKGSRGGSAPGGASAPSAVIAPEKPVYSAASFIPVGSQPDEAYAMPADWEKGIDYAADGESAGFVEEAMVDAFWDTLEDMESFDKQSVEEEISYLLGQDKDDFDANGLNEDAVKDYFATDPDGFPIDARRALKAQICKQIGDGMGERVDTDAGMWVAMDGELEANAIIKGWAGSSNRSRVSDVVQAQAAELFGVARSDWQIKQSLSDGSPISRAIARRFLKVSYDETQQKLKDAIGPKDFVTLYRGMGSPDNDPPKGPLTYTGNALESFTLSPNVAQVFADMGGGNIVSVKVPRRRIVSSCLTGLGCAVEQEFIVAVGGLGLRGEIRPASSYK